MQQRKFRITGCGRSGTGYMAALMQAMGYDVGHETLGADGISSWMAAAVCEDVPHKGSPIVGVEFATTIHVVRDPMKAIPSIAVNFRAITWRYVERFILIDRDASAYDRAAMYWVGWNRLVAAQNPDLIVPVDVAAAVLPQLLAKRGETPGRPETLPPSTVNHRVTTPAWNIVEPSLPAWLLSAITEQAAGYGYAVGGRGNAR